MFLIKQSEVSMISKVLPFIIPWFSIQITYKPLLPLKLVEQMSYALTLSSKLLNFKDNNVLCFTYLRNQLAYLGKTF